MAVADHYELAKRLKRMSGAYVPAAGDPRWDVVMLFYSALHVTTAYLVSVGCGAPTTHQDMNAAVRTRPELDSRFRSAYTTLSTASWNIRYNPGFVMLPRNRQIVDDRFRVVRGWV